jgi:hypothetical protein
MNQYKDRFENLHQAVDVGGDLYYMGPEKTVELGFKTYKNFQDSFGSDSRTEYLIRKYLYYSLKDKKRTKFDNDEEKQELINILKKRAKQLEESKQFTNSTLKSEQIKRSFLNIQQLIKIFEGPEYEGVEFPKLPSIPKLFECTKSKKFIKELTNDQIFNLILEMAWYLLHPQKVPSEIECKWADLIQQLDKLRINDIITEIKQSDSNNIENGTNALNYFDKINVKKFIKANNIESALDEAKNVVNKIQDENENNKLKERLKILLQILQMKKYLSNDLENNSDNIKIIGEAEVEKIKKNMIRNPMSGGAIKTIEKSLGNAMKHFFDYYKIIYYPIYDFIESNLSNYLKINNSNINNIKKVIIPQLTTLLHMCNNLNPSEGEKVAAGLNTYGIYRIKNIDDEIISFINSMLKSTQTYLTTIPDDTEKNIFNEQLFHLPKVRLSSLVNKFGNSKLYKDPDQIPYIQFFTVGGNITLMPQEKFLGSKNNPELNQEVYNAINDFLKPTDLYIICTQGKNKSQDIPMNVYEIDFDSIDVSNNGIKIDNIPDNYFNKYKDPVLYFEKIVELSPYVVFNDAELALSIFIAFKDLMPN